MKSTTSTFKQIIEGVKSGAVVIDLKLPVSFRERAVYETEITKDAINNLNWYLKRENDGEVTFPLIVKSSHGFLDPISGIEYMLVMFESDRITIGSFDDNGDIVEAPGHDADMVVEDYVECLISVPSGYLSIGGNGLAKVMVESLDGYRAHSFVNRFEDSLGAAKEHIGFVQAANVFHVPSGVYASYYKKGGKLIIASQAVDDLVMDYDVDVDALGTKLRDASYSDESYSLVVCDRDQALEKATSQGVSLKGKMDTIKVTPGIYKVTYMLKRRNPEDVVYCQIERV
jgi:hypothetical protein